MNLKIGNYNQHITACKRHNPAAGATQGYGRLHAKRYGQVYERDCLCIKY